MATNFVEQVRLGNINRANISMKMDEWVEDWHCLPEPASSLSLRDFLGFSEEEFQLFLHNPLILANQLIEKYAG